MRVHWTTPALRALEAIQDHIAQDSPAAAHRVAGRIRDAVDGLAVHPLRGRPGRVSGTNELVTARTSYTAAYRVRNEVVEALGVFHQRQRWPEYFDDAGTEIDH